MKKTLLTLALTACTLGVSAQKAPGTITVYPRVGMNISKFTGDLMTTDLTVEGASLSSTAGLNIGAEVQYQIGEIMAVSGGIFYSQQGTHYKYTYNDPITNAAASLSATVHHDDINIPILAVATLPKNFSVKLGIQPEIRMSNKATDDIMKSFNLSIPVGVAYEYKNIALDVRYNFGVTNIYKSGNSKNSTFMLTLGYRIDL